MEQSRHNEAVHLFNESNNVEQALKQQIITAIEDTFLTPLRNRQTNTIDVTIPVILDYLYTNHGKVSPAMLQEEERAVKEMVYDTTHPIDIIFNKVEDLLDLSVAANADFTAQQLINIAYVIINRTGKYQTYIREWLRTPAADKTWTNFKTAFRRAHQELKEAGDLELKDTPYASANLVQDVIDGVQTALAQDSPPPPDLSDHTDTISHLANNAAQHQLLPQMMAQMVQMMEQMATIQQQLANQTLQSTPTNSQPTRPRRTNTSKYCWSHGACAHDGNDCKAKKPGHIDTATFHNKMGGSTAFCRPAE